jgi:tRNA(adenine34) deaminase
MEMIEKQKMAIDFYPLMKQALREAEKGFAKGEVPVGALLTNSDGRILAKAHNLPISRHDPTAHAEILALRNAGEFYKNYRLTGCTLVVTLEPCIMCMGAAFHARISQLVFGAFDPKSGAAGSLYDLPADRRFNHRIEVISGIMGKECGDLLQNFFRDRREKNHVSDRRRNQIQAV